MIKWHQFEGWAAIVAMIIAMAIGGAVGYAAVWSKQFDMHYASRHDCVCYDKGAK